ncbi:MAG: hypothetical protein ACYDBB_11380 [Armatimonadota bacterium]
MAKDTITLALNGDVPLDLFVKAMSHLNNLVVALSDDIGVSDKVKWFIDDLQPGSAIVTMRGESAIEYDIERIVAAYGDLGKSLETGKRPKYSNRVVTEATAITGVLNGCITSVRFETPDIDAMVASPTQIDLVAESKLMPRKALGAVRGQIETISRHKGLRFNLYDATYNRAVSCYLDKDEEGIMREMWGKCAIVEGDVTRDSLGRPVAIRHIINIREAEEHKRGSYLAARGIAPRKTDSLRPEEIIRRLRDAK